MSYFLGIDIGTSSVKTSLVDHKGTVLAKAEYRNTTMQPLPNSAEQHADADWWGGSAYGVKSCLEIAQIDPRQIKGISVCGMVPNLCPLDQNGQEVRPAILYRDGRAIEQVEFLTELMQLEFTTQDVAPKLLWLKENEPENYAKISVVLNAHSYVVYRLTGQYSTDRDSASIFGHVYDVNIGWNEERICRMGLQSSVLPPIYAPLDIVGYTQEEVADELGLVSGIPVIAGTGDSFTVLVGSGTVEKDAGVIYLGSAATLLSLEQSLDDLVDTLPFLTGDVRFIGNVLMGGTLVSWLSEQAMGGAKCQEELEAGAAEIPPGSEGLFFLPHLRGKRSPVPDEKATGVIIGVRDNHDWRHFYRAALEGVAYALRESFEASNKQLASLRLLGGGCRSAVWRSILVNVFGMKAGYSPTADNALGTAFMAGLATGELQSYKQISEQWIIDMDLIEPASHTQSVYERGYETYIALSEHASHLNLE